MIAIPGRTIVQKATVVVFSVAYALMVLLFGVIAHDQFRDGRLLETEAKVKGTIMTIQPRKGGTWGTISYRLPNGPHCNDWTEFAPNGVVRLGDLLTVAVGQTCGHSVSTKKRLLPWVYLCLCVGGVLYPLYVAWETSRRTVPPDA